MLAGISHLAAKHKTPTGKDIANRSVIVMFVSESDSEWAARKNGSNTAQIITAVKAKYGIAKISNMLNRMQFLEIGQQDERSSRENIAGPSVWDR